MKGVVKWFNEQRGYGFIIENGSKADWFIHYSQINSESKFKKLYEGDVVEFDVCENKNGKMAGNVRLVTPSELRASVKSRRINNE